MKSLRRKLQHLLLRPIRVFLFHQVGERYDAGLCNQGDWNQIEDFKAKIIGISSEYSFISLTEAEKHLKSDIIRLKKYAVLTSDDGAASLKSILPWLRERRIPVTLFINGKYLDGVSFRERSTECYLTKEELFSLDYDGIEVGHHGWEHNDLTQMEWSKFIDSVEKNIEMLQSHPRYIPAWAYTWGKYSKKHNDYLVSRGISPVFIDGMKNYAGSVIHRELIDG